jgi:hypothetical protein
MASHLPTFWSRQALWILVVPAIAAIGAIFASVRTRDTPVTYHAVARVELSHLPPESGQTAALVRRASVALQRVHLDRDDRVQVIGSPGNRWVQVSAVAPRYDAALAAANNVAGQLLADDRGVDRAALARRIDELQQKLGAATGARAERLRKTLRLARARQVGKDDFQPAAAAVRATGPRPVQDPLVAAAIGALAAAAALAVASRLTLRPPKLAGPG